MDSFCIPSNSTITGITLNTMVIDDMIKPEPQPKSCYKPPVPIVSGVMSRSQFSEYYDRYTRKRLFGWHNISMAYSIYVNKYENGKLEPLCSQSNEKEKKEQDMTTTIELDQRSYLERRISDVKYDKQREVRKTFNMDVDNYPRTYKDLIEKITKGQYKLDEKRTKKVDAQIEAGDFWGHMTDGIIWGGDVVADEDGYAAATKELDKFYKDTKDTVKLSPIADGLAALKALEAWQPTGKAN